MGFDFDHTLGLDNKLERVTFLWLLDLVVARGGHALGTVEQESVTIDKLLEEQRSGAFCIDEAVRRFVDARSSADPAPYIERYRAQALQNVERFVRPLPGCAELLTCLRAREVPVAVLTNGWSPLQSRKAQAVGFTGPVLASDRIGALKPDPRAFAAVQSVLNCPVDRILYVGDNPLADIAGSIAVGMQGVWLDAEGISYPKDIEPPTATIHTLLDLLELV
ncbi:MAG: HAD family hydrolase [Candidatus Baltobacteraceae bacterium]